MKIFVEAKAGARREGVTALAPGCFRIAVHDPPVEGRANRSILKALAAHLNLSPSRLVLVSGHTHRHKIIEVVP